MRVLSTVINLGEGLQPETKQGRHADIVAPFKSEPPVYTTFRRPEMVHIHTRTSNAESRPKIATTVLQTLSG